MCAFGLGSQPCPLSSVQVVLRRLANFFGTSPRATTFEGRGWVPGSTQSSAVSFFSLEASSRRLPSGGRGDPRGCGSPAIAPLLRRMRESGRIRSDAITQRPPNPSFFSSEIKCAHPIFAPLPGDPSPVTSTVVFKGGGQIC